MAKFSIKKIGSKAKKSLINSATNNSKRNNDTDGIKKAAGKALKFVLKRSAPILIATAAVVALLLTALFAGTAASDAVSKGAVPFTVSNPNDTCDPGTAASQREQFVQIFFGDGAVADLIGAAADFWNFATGFFQNRNIELGCEDDINLEGVEGWTWPILREPPMVISSPFGPRNTDTEGASRDHKGTDYAYACGVPIVAANEGVVARAGWWGGYGYAVQVNHDFEETGANLTRYAHMTAGTITVSAGQRVSSGQIIGLVGTTGISSGCHLHFEVWRGVPIDPHAFVERMIRIQQEREEREAREDRARAESANRRGAN